MLAPPVPALGAGCMLALKPPSPGPASHALPVHRLLVGQAHSPLLASAMPNLQVAGEAVSTGEGSGAIGFEAEAPPLPTSGAIGFDMLAPPLPSPLQVLPFHFVPGGQAQIPLVGTMPAWQVDTGGNAATLTQDCAPGAPVPSEASAQFENCLDDASLGKRTTILKLRAPNGLPSGASKSRRTGPGDVHEKGICVGCAAHGSGGVIETICAEVSPVSLSEIVTGALWSIGPGLNSLIVKLQSPPRAQD
jgi:hypothetical protein